MTVLMIGSAGVMTMQKASIQSNLDARKLDMANSIAHEWLERLATDSTQWTLPSNNVSAVNNLTNTRWLRNQGSPGTWFLPTLPGTYPADGLSPAFDILGRDLDGLDAPNAVFCTHLKIDTIAQDSLVTPVLLRATVLVFWKKLLLTSTASPGGNCTAWFDVAQDEFSHPGTWHIIYATTAIRRNTIQ